MRIAIIFDPRRGCSAEPLDYCPNQPANRAQTASSGRRPRPRRRLTNSFFYSARTSTNPFCPCAAPWRTRKNQISSTPPGFAGCPPPPPPPPADPARPCGACPASRPDLADPSGMTAASPEPHGGVCVSARSVYQNSGPPSRGVFWEHFAFSDEPFRRSAGPGPGAIRVNDQSCGPRLSGSSSAAPPRRCGVRRPPPGRRPAKPPAPRPL